MHVIELRDVLGFRLTPDASAHLGLNDVQDPQVSLDRQKKDWYNRTWHAFRRLHDLLDPYPAPRRMMNLTERRHVKAARDPEAAARKLERLHLISNTLLEATIQLLPRETRRAWDGSVSFDQTPVRAMSKRGRGGRTNRVEATEKDNIVMELDADWYAINPEFRGNEDEGKKKDLVWAYAANIAIPVPAKGGAPRDFPNIAVAFNFSRPNEDLGGATVAMLRSLQDRGHPAGRATGDRAYFAQLSPEDLAYPVRAMGYRPLTDYKRKKNEASVDPIQGGNNNAGTVLVEGQHLCPCTPDKLINANRVFMGLTIPTREDEDIRDSQLKERDHYRVRIKEGPNEHGDTKRFCPAVGPGATVTCSRREPHPNISKKDKPHVLAPDVDDEDLPPICAQTSVTFYPQDDDRYLQDITWQSPEWRETYRHDRNDIEGFNAYIKNPNKEALDATGRRLVRGFTGQQLLVTMLLVSANIRSILTFLYNQARPPRKKRKPRMRGHNSLKNYVPWLHAAVPIEVPLRT